MHLSQPKLCTEKKRGLHSRWIYLDFHRVTWPWWQTLINGSSVKYICPQCLWKLHQLSRWSRLPRVNTCCHALQVGGVNASQTAVYEEFARSIPGFHPPPPGETIPTPAPLPKPVYEHGLLASSEIGAGAVSRKQAAKGSKELQAPQMPGKTTIYKARFFECFLHFFYSLLNLSCS